ncbi:MAG: hypothetical protein AAGC44_13830 [Planctomycetota bacterium]
MKNLLTLSLTTASLLIASSIYAGTNCRNGCDRDGSGEEDPSVAVVAEDEQMQGERPQRDRGEGAEGERPRRGGEQGERPRRGGGDPLRALDLSDDQKEQVKEIMEANRAEAREIMETARAAKEAGEDVDREAIREQLGALREAARLNVYENVLNEEQQAKMDEIREKMEARRAEMQERRGERGERPQRGGDSDGERPQRRRGGGEGSGLDL